VNCFDIRRFAPGNNQGGSQWTKYTSKIMDFRNSR